MTQWTGDKAGSLSSHFTCNRHWKIHYNSLFPLHNWSNINLYYKISPKIVLPYGMSLTGSQVLYKDKPQRTQASSNVCVCVYSRQAYCICAVRPVSSTVNCLLSLIKSDSPLPSANICARSQQLTQSLHYNDLDLQKNLQKLGKQKFPLWFVSNSHPDFNHNLNPLWTDETERTMVMSDCRKVFWVNIVHHYVQSYCLLGNLEQLKIPCTL